MASFSPSPCPHAPKYVKKKQFCYQFILFLSTTIYYIFHIFSQHKLSRDGMEKICVKYSTKFINTSRGTTLLSLMNSFPQNVHHAFTIMQSKLFEFRCASWWTPCTRNRFPRIATSSEKVSLAQLFYSVHSYSYIIVQHISIVISTRILSSYLQPPDQLAIKLLHKLRKIKNMGFWKR